MLPEIEDLMRAIREADRPAALDILKRHQGAKGVDATLRELLDPALETIGKEWEAGAQTSLAQGYVAAKIAGDFLLALGLDNSAMPVHTKAKVVIGNCEDDFHSLGRNMLGVFLRSAGYEVRDLGNDVLAKDFVDAAMADGALIIGVSAMMYSTARNILKIRAELDGRGLSGKIKLAVGGAVFRLRPELVSEVGADGTAATALQAPQLFDRLLAEAQNHDRA